MDLFEDLIPASESQPRKSLMFVPRRRNLANPVSDTRQSQFNRLSRDYRLAR